MTRRENDCARVLRDVFGFPGYKGNQQEIIESAMKGLDVFVVAPTGMGKSLCFQIPAISAESGISIVVSPLLALIKDQIEKLRSKAVAASALSSATRKEEKNEIMKDLSSGEPTIKLLYITPERLCTSDFMSLLKHLYEKGKINRLVVDEEWGHDFREEYRRLGTFRDRFADVPIMALTATATPMVQSDIIQSLKMDREHLYQALHPSNRDNLFYEIRYTSAPTPVSQMADICDYIWNLHRKRGRTSSGIIYCRTRATCDELSAYLRGRGLNSRPYHKGLRPHALDKTLTEWSEEDGGVDVVVATIAFGLGIDKSDVRYVMHYDLPKSFEGYYQETGRAGRDGLPAKCILYYSREDALTVKKWVSEAHSRRLAGARNGPAPSQRSPDSLAALIRFAEGTTTCRHISICQYFGERIDTNDATVLQKYCNNMCDVCKYQERTQRRHGKLSSEEFALSQLASNRNTSYQDEDDQLNQKPELNYDKQQVNADSRLVRGQSKAPVKRPSDQNTNRNHKKLKVEMAPPLVTKPFNSVSALKKPFKAPLLTSKAFENVPEAPAPQLMEVQVNKPQSPVQTDAIDLTEEVMDVESDTVMDISEDVYAPSDDDVELDASFSTKIPPPLRFEAYRQIKRSLSKVFASDDMRQTTLTGYLAFYPV
ncbi:P-loop containing nucleoside triphosphate hydrolase protein [Amanita rubescens]|nr:P-loop containing nucleoside triphosphate hydrolase protein [Amanita rubescens]